MHLPKATSRSIVSATAAVVVCGSTVLTWQHFAKPVAPTNQSVSVAASLNKAPGAAQETSKETAKETAKDAPNTAAPAAQAAQPEKKELQPKEKVSTYTVQPGDTIGAIAEKVGLKSESILMTNNLSEDDLIQPGQELTIPGVDGTVVEVADGDTMWNLATDYGVDETAIVNANPDISPENLQLGQKVLIPGAKPIQRNQLASRGGTSVRSGHKLLWPHQDIITDPFGWRIHPVYGTRSFHDGIDINAPEGTPLIAAAGGTVIMAERYSSYGLAVRIDHGGGLVTMYAHMSQIDVKVGQHVAAGEHIGYSGNTGVTTGPHLHFSVIVDGNPVDPMDWLP